MRVRNGQPEGFGGRRVVALESRHASEMAVLIQTWGGEPQVAASMREVPLAANTAAFRFGEQLLAGEWDAVLFLTGVGLRALLEVLETRWSREQLVAALRKVVRVARGPKPTRVLRECGLEPDVQIPEPNTWREVVATLESNPGGLILNGCRLAIQEYGAPSPELVSALRQRGATVATTPVYRWALPEDQQPLRQAVQELAAGRAEVLLFTNAQQVVHLLQVAAAEGH
ncbi:MAG: uroporphyrinogen-III synthase, partial [Armatimonadetes bacterium]|nr:uroporphyrinogen-III synthase [Armatimonadota bacterium]